MVLADTRKETEMATKKTTIKKPVAKKPVAKKAAAAKEPAEKEASTKASTKKSAVAEPEVVQPKKNVAAVAKWKYSVSDGEVTIDGVERWLRVKGDLEIPDTMDGCPVTSICTPSPTAPQSFTSSAMARHAMTASIIINNFLPIYSMLFLLDF